MLSFGNPSATEHAGSSEGGNFQGTLTPEKFQPKTNFKLLMFVINHNSKKPRGVFLLNAIETRVS